MVSNINSQAKEVACLRAVGVQRVDIVKAFVYEAFILIASASFSGIAIGYFISWLMAQQRNLLSKFETTFSLPWAIVLQVLLVAVVAGLLTAYLPARKLAHRPIADLFQHRN